MDESRSSWKARLGCASLLVGLTAALAAPVPATAAGAHSAAAAKKTTCSLAKNGRSLGPTYVETLAVTGTSCNTGYTLIKDYNACRLKAGGTAGHCTTPVLGFKCTEKRSSSPIQFIASVTCTKPKQSVLFSYSENI